MVVEIISEMIKIRELMVYTITKISFWREGYDYLVERLTDLVFKRG